MIRHLLSQSRKDEYRVFRFYRYSSFGSYPFSPVFTGFHRFSGFTIHIRCLIGSETKLIQNIKILCCSSYLMILPVFPRFFRIFSRFFHRFFSFFRFFSYTYVVYVVGRLAYFRVSVRFGF